MRDLSSSSKTASLGINDPSIDNAYNKALSDSEQSENSKGSTEVNVQNSFASLKIGKKTGQAKENPKEILLSGT